MAHHGVFASRIDTVLGPSEDGSAFLTWKTRLALMFETRLSEGINAKDFTIRGSTWQLPGAVLTDAAGTAIELHRTKAYIERNPLDHIGLYFATAGLVNADYDGRSVTVEPGDIVLIDYSRPMRSIAGDFANSVITFDRKSGPSIFRTGVLHGARLHADDPIARLLHSQLTALIKVIDGLPITAAEVSLSALLSIAASAWNGRGRGEGTDAHSMIDKAVAVMRRYISNPDLDPDMIALHLGVSRARLYRLFEPYGGVRSYFGQLRLDESLKTLCSQPPATGMISDVAFRHGFKSSAQFSRVFRARFGRTPREILTLRRAWPKAELYTKWLETRREQPTFGTIDAWLNSIVK